MTSERSEVFGEPLSQDNHGVIKKIRNKTETKLLLIGIFIEHNFSKPQLRILDKQEPHQK